MAELRAVAKKLKIRNILSASKTKENSSFLINGQQVLRVNLIVTIINDPFVSTTYCQCMVDDGSGQINIRNFDDKNFFDDLSAGDSVLIIGKLRQYNNEIYVIGEIIKKVENKKWFEVRNLELKNFNLNKNKKGEQKTASQETDYDEILLMISDADSGEGVEFDVLINERGIEPKKLNYLLEKGELFFIKPGKVKVLK